MLGELGFSVQDMWDRKWSPEVLEVYLAIDSVLEAGELGLSERLEGDGIAPQA